MVFPNLVKEKLFVKEIKKGNTYLGPCEGLFCKIVKI